MMRPFAVSCLVPIRGRLLFVRHTYGVANGRILIPGGYLQEGELPSHAAERELLEETGVTAKSRGVFAARCKGGQWILVIRMEYVSGEPRSDGHENSEVLLLKPENAILRPDITNMSRFIMKAYIDAPDRVIPLSEEVPPTYDPARYEFYGV